MADVKGDFSGISAAGSLSPKMKERLETLELDEPTWEGCPVARAREVHDLRADGRGQALRRWLPPGCGAPGPPPARRKAALQPLYMTNRQPRASAACRLVMSPGIQRSQNPGPWGASFPLMVIVVSMGASHFH
jgi:hypothetical protein